MQVGVGYSDNPDSMEAGVQAAKGALGQSGRNDPCDMALLFSTARHDQRLLREAVVSVVGESIPIYGGGAVGIITNDYYGYAGDQIGLACIWLDGVSCDVLIDGGMPESEEEAGLRLGRRLAELGTTSASPVMLFYDALDYKDDGFRMLMATWLLNGIEKGLGFLPDLTGAGMQGDHTCSPTSQWIGDGIGEHYAMALAFSGDVRIDSVIMHGCHPATPYYTVTKSDGPVILEINGKPAIQFVDELLDSSIAPEDYPFFLIFGINHGERWEEYDENYYASRLCLGIDKERGGIVMFEPDMVEGTEFQIMFRSLDLDYMKPKIDKVFNDLDGREPVFAMYIDCAGRCAGYGGMDIEDAFVIQKTVAGRVPVLGLYTGVEIASIGGRPRGLDWTGVFCLFSQSKDGKVDTAKKSDSAPAWDLNGLQSKSNEVSVEAIVRICEKNAAKILDLDTKSITIRHELEQKRRGFSLLAELSVSLRQNTSYESVFIPVAQRINAALNMQRTVVLTPDDKGFFTAAVLQGYSADEKAMLAGRHIDVPSELLNTDFPVLVTGADPLDRLKELRELLKLPCLISAPVILQDEVAAILITGRIVEAHPYLLRLGRNDVETVQAISALLASVLAGQRLAAAEERNKIMLDAMPMCCVFWDEYGNQTDCNQEALSFFELSSKEEFLERYYKLSPEYQPDGLHSEEEAREKVMKAFVSGHARFEWTYKTLSGKLIPSEVTMERVPWGGDYIMAGYIRDLREQKAAMAKLSEARDMAERNAQAKSEFLASVSHEIRTPMNAIIAMVQAVSNSGMDDKQQKLIDQGMRSAKLLTAAIESLLDFSKIDSGQLTLENGEFSIHELIDSIDGMLRRDAEEKSLYLRKSIGPDVPEILVGDSIRLEQAVFNIAANAVKFTETGGVEIRVVREEASADGKVELTFEVNDTGIGISEEHMADLFNPLKSGDTAFNRKRGGLGMGLAISKSLAMLMGGEIICESRPDKGTTFSLTVPLSMPEEKAADTEELSKASDADELYGMRVLVAEDNVINQMIVEEILSSAGINVTIANNGFDALDALKNESFDIILMDIQMPEMDGLTATAQIRANHRYDDLPILAMTANAGTEHRAESMKAGMNDHLTKPIDVEQLYSALKRWGKRNA